jgi:hypothetical protein
MPEIAQFQKIAPFLVNPLVLIGLSMVLLFGVHRALIKQGIFAKLTQRQSSGIIRLILKHGFALAFIVVILGFAYGFWRFRDAEKEHASPGVIVQQTGACGSNIVGDNNKADVNCVDKTPAPKVK